MMLSVLILAALSTVGDTAAEQPATASQVLQLYHRAVAPNGALPPGTWQAHGSLKGANLVGTFSSWHDAEHDRMDQDLGIARARTLRIADRVYLQNSSGNVIELNGILLRRSRTQDFLSSTELFSKPQYSHLLGRTMLPDGRDVFQLEVSPPDGETETLDIDTRSHLLDRLEYIDGDGLFTIDFSDYRPVNGFLFAFKEVQSDGDHPYDVTQTTTQLDSRSPIPTGTFAPLQPSRLDATEPITVPLTQRAGGLYADVTIFGRNFSFLVDSGAQAVVLDSKVAASLLLVPQGSLEARGTTRSGGIGVALLDHLAIGGATLPVRVASILDLNASTAGHFAIDGILGFPLFGAGVVRIDAGHATMTLAPTDPRASWGEPFEVDVDRELPEIVASVNGVQGRFLMDTGNGNELLLFHNFLDAHRGVLTFNPNGPIGSYGVGGGTRAYATDVDELDIGSYRFYHANTNVMLSTEGAFADRFDAGNIGLGILKNFVVTFDLPNRMLYLKPGTNFDDGRGRSVFRQ